MISIEVFRDCGVWNPCLHESDLPKLLCTPKWLPSSNMMMGDVRKERYNRYPPLSIHEMKPSLKRSDTKPLHTSIFPLSTNTHSRPFPHRRFNLSIYVWTIFSFFNGWASFGQKRCLHEQLIYRLSGAFFWNADLTQVSLCVVDVCIRNPCFNYTRWKAYVCLLA
jgi:hypothetical protein